MVKKYSLILIGIVFISGCLGNNIDNVVKSAPEIKQFLAEHPDAEITTIYWDTERVSSEMTVIESDCGEKLETKPYYRVDVESSDLTMVAYVDVESQEMICSKVKGQGTTTTTSLIVTKTTSTTSTSSSTTTIPTTTTSTSVTTTSTTTSSTTTSTTLSESQVNTTKSLSQMILYLEDLPTGFSHGTNASAGEDEAHPLDDVFDYNSLILSFREGNFTFVISGVYRYSQDFDIYEHLKNDFTGYYIWAAQNRTEFSTPTIGDESFSLNASNIFPNNRTAYYIVFKKYDVVATIEVSGLPSDVMAADAIEYAQIVESRIA